MFDVGHGTIYMRVNYRQRGTSMSNMNWVAKLIGIIVVLTPLAYGAWGMYNAIHGLLGN